jgi:hypothetical protein
LVREIRLAKEKNVSKNLGAQKRDKQESGSAWVKRDAKSGKIYDKDIGSYGFFRGEQLPPPGRNNVIVRTPNPLPSPKETNS